MRVMIPAAALILLLSQPATAQDWARFVSIDDGFSANYPGQPKVETITYTSQYEQPLPGKVYSAADALGRYSTTVVDYRILFVAMAVVVVASAGYLVTRQHDSPAPAAEQLLT